MMVAMMLPSAAPMILLFVTVNRRRQTQGRAATPPAVFAAGYVGVWSMFSLGGHAPPVGPTPGWSPVADDDHDKRAVLGGAVLVSAGIYQWMPFKNSCLRYCQSPHHFISQHWRSGAAEAFRMGWQYGLYRLGCCWFLMELLFVGGVMNLLWIAGLALFVLLEKLLGRRWVPMSSGVALVVWGTLVVVRSI